MMRDFEDIVELQKNFHPQQYQYTKQVFQSYILPSKRPP